MVYYVTKWFTKDEKRFKLNKMVQKLKKFNSKIEKN